MGGNCSGCRSRVWSLISSCDLFVLLRDVFIIVFVHGDDDV